MEWILIIALYMQQGPVDVPAGIKLKLTYRDQASCFQAEKEVASVAKKQSTYRMVSLGCRAGEGT